MNKIALNERIAESTVIVESRIISKKSVWDNQHRSIYTLNEVDVYKIFKGKIRQERITIVTEGGIVDGESETVTPSVQFKVDDIGILLLKQSRKEKELSNATQGETVFEVIASSQGFLLYDFAMNSATDVFSRYTNISESLYSTIQALTGNSIQEIKPFSFGRNNKEKNGRLNAGVEITSFTPKSISAGTKSVLTIRGTGFGSMSNRTIFLTDGDSPERGLIAPVPLEYLSWNDTEIRIYVPSRCGTGKVYLYEKQNDVWTPIATSKDTLLVRFARSNDSYSTRNPVNLVNSNRDGGYTWQMSKSFAENTAARQSLELVFDKWRCVSDVNWKLGQLTDVNTSVRDSLNVIHFAPASEFSSGTLGICTSRTLLCGSTTAYVAEADLKFNNTVSWNFSSEKCPPTLHDFQSVALHELGHALQLDHVVDTNEIMHYAIGKGTMRRFPTTNSIEGVKFVLQQSSLSQQCGPSNMLSAAPQVNCQLLLTTDVDQSQEIMQDYAYPMPFSESCTIQFNVEKAAMVKLEIYDALGHKIMQPLESFHNSGNYTTLVSFQGYSKGVYFYRLQIGDRIVSKSIIRGF